MAIKIKGLSLNLPFGLGGVTIDVNDAEQRAAWALYVEYGTRIVGVEGEQGPGSPREALSSLYTLFDTTRDVLREAGPDIAHGTSSLGPLAIRALNEGVRPFIVAWHTTLLAHEARQEEPSPDERARFDRELADLRGDLRTFTRALGEIAGIGSPE